MAKSSVVHATFVVERTFEATPAEVFNAFADPKAKARGFVGPSDWESGPREFDFRIGGRERTSGGPKGGPIHSFDCIYQDIVPNERIIYTYDMHADKARISVSLATIEFSGADKGTRLVLTEQGAFLDGYSLMAGRRAGHPEDGAEKGWMAGSGPIIWPKVNPRWVLGRYQAFASSAACQA
jgi:uncharacterized protein YndB with AHSA1/START domain